MRNSNGQFNKKYEINESFFNNKNKYFYYLLGLLSSDGNVKNDRTFSLTQSNDKGKKLIEFVSNMINSTYPIYTNNQVNSHTITITNQTVVKVLKKYNIIPNKTLTFILSDNIPNNVLKYFIQGYIDGDGSVGIYDNGNGVKSLIVSVVGTEDFINQINKKLNTKGNIRKIKNCKNLYEIRYNGKKALDLCNEIYDDVIYKSHKYNNFITFKNNTTVGVKYKKYYNVKNTIIERVKKGHDVKTLSEIYNVPLKTIYTWKYRNN